MRIRSQSAERAGLPGTAIVAEYVHTPETTRLLGETIAYVMGTLRHTSCLHTRLAFATRQTEGAT
jgi:hypothetical protein